MTLLVVSNNHNNNLSLSQLTLNSNSNLIQLEVSSSLDKSPTRLSLDLTNSKHSNMSQLSTSNNSSSQMRANSNSSNNAYLVRLQSRWMNSFKAPQFKVHFPLTTLLQSLVPPPTHPPWSSLPQPTHFYLRSISIIREDDSRDNEISFYPGHGSNSGRPPSVGGVLR